MATRVFSSKDPNLVGTVQKQYTDGDWAEVKLTAKAGKANGFYLYWTEPAPTKELLAA